MANSSFRLDREYWFGFDSAKDLIAIWPITKIEISLKCIKENWLLLSFPSTFAPPPFLPHIPFRTSVSKIFVVVFLKRYSIALVTAGVTIQGKLNLPPLLPFPSSLSLYPRWSTNAFQILLLMTVIRERSTALSVLVRSATLQPFIKWIYLPEYRELHAWESLVRYRTSKKKKKKNLLFFFLTKRCRLNEMK